MHNSHAFWAPYPLPSVALDDPLFVRPIPRNSWGGASQALTALRAGRWFDHYNRSSAFSFMMDRWCDALQRDGTFRQQVDPLQGVFTPGDAAGYSPAALVFYDYTWRLGGIRQEREVLHWNVRPGHPATQNAHFKMRTNAGQIAELIYAGDGVQLYLGGRLMGSVHGGTVRVVTGERGELQQLWGVAETGQHILFERPSQPPQELTILPDQRWHGLRSP